MIRSFAVVVLTVAAALSGTAEAAPVNAGTHPFNGQIVFVSKGNEIHTFFPRTKLRRKIAVGTDPTFSSNGKKIVYASGGSIWAMQADGSAKREIYDANANLTDLDWSPDGTGFLWREQHSGNKFHVRAMSFGDAQPRTLFSAQEQSVDSAVWTNDNRVLAGLYTYMPEVDFDVANRDGTSRTNVEWSLFRPVALDVAPDGRIVFAEHRHVYVEDGTASGFRHFDLPGVGEIGDLAVSPDGLWVVISNMAAGERTGLWVARLDGSLPPVQITKGAHTSPTWQSIPSLVPNLPPVALPILIPGANQMVDANASASLDPDGQITQYRWEWGDNDGFTEGPVTTHHYAEPGSYYVTLRLTDNLGAKTTVGSWVIVT